MFLCTWAAAPERVLQKLFRVSVMSKALYYKGNSDRARYLPMQPRFQHSNILQRHSLSAQIIANNASRFRCASRAARFLFNVLFV